MDNTQGDLRRVRKMLAGAQTKFTRKSGLIKKVEMEAKKTKKTKKAKKAGISSSLRFLPFLSFLLLLSPPYKEADYGNGSGNKGKSGC